MTSIDHYWQMTTMNNVIIRCVFERNLLLAISKEQSCEDGVVEEEKPTRLDRLSRSFFFFFITLSRKQTILSPFKLDEQRQDFHYSLGNEEKLHWCVKRRKKISIKCSSPFAVLTKRK